MHLIFSVFGCAYMDDMDGQEKMVVCSNIALAYACLHLFLIKLIAISLNPNESLKIE